MFWFRRTTTPLSVQVGVECGQSTIASQSSLRRTLSAISKLLQVGCDGGVESRAFSLLLAQQRGEARHLLVERFAVVFDSKNNNKTTKKKNETMFADDNKRNRQTKTNNVFIFSRVFITPPCVV